jgi:hypothetical protein
MKRTALLVALLALALLPYPASASLIFDSSLGGVSGSGLGNVATILTITSPGSTSTESGSVSFNGTTDVTSNTGVIATGGTVSFGNVQTGASQTLTRTLGSLGITTAGQIGIVLNAAEPSGDAITLTGLQFTLFNGGATFFSASLPTAQTFPTTFTGTGNQGFVFKLDAAQAATLNGLLAGLTPAQIAALRLGASASASGATGGQETFNLTQITGGVTPVPEPGTVVLLGSALLIGAGWSFGRSRR